MKWSKEARYGIGAYVSICSSHQETHTLKISSFQHQKFLSNSFIAHSAAHPLEWIFKNQLISFAYINFVVRDASLLRQSGYRYTERRFLALKRARFGINLLATYSRIVQKSAWIPRKIVFAILKIWNSCQHV